MKNREASLKFSELSLNSGVRLHYGEQGSPSGTPVIYWERIDILADVIYAIFAPIEAVALTPDEWRQGESFIVDYARNGEVHLAA